MQKKTMLVLTDPYLPGRNCHPRRRALQDGLRRWQQQHDHDGRHQGQDHRRGRVQGRHRKRARQRRKVLHALRVRFVLYVYLIMYLFQTNKCIFSIYICPDSSGMDFRSMLKKKKYAKWGNDDDVRVIKINNTLIVTHKVQWEICGMIV